MPSPLITAHADVDDFDRTLLPALANLEQQPLQRGSGLNS